MLLPKRKNVHPNLGFIEGVRKTTVENVALIIGYLFVGWVLQRFRSMPEDTSLVLNQYVIHVALPAMILLYLPQLEITREVLTPILTPWVMYGLALLLVWLASRIFKWERTLTGALMVVIPLGNTAFLGFPFVEAFYGKEGLPYAVLYDQAGSFLALVLITSFIVAVYTGAADAQKPTLKSQLLRLIKFPPAIALIAALTVGQTEYPIVVQPLLETLAATLIPVVMVAVGFQLKLRIERAYLLPFTIGLTIKLIILPLAAFTGFYVLGMKGLAVQVSIIEAAMPPMITGGAIAIAAGLKPRFVASLLGYGVLIGVVTLTGIQHLISSI